MSMPPETDRATRASGWRWTLVLFGPLIAVVGLQSLLDFISGTPPADWQWQRITSVPIVNSWGQAFWQAASPLIYTVVALLLAIWALRWLWRRGNVAQRTRWLVALWWGICALVAVLLLVKHLNAVDRQPLDDVTVTPVQVQAKEPSQRSVGGMEVIFTQSAVTAGNANPAPQQVLLEGATPEQVQRGQPVTLQRAQGRYVGTYVTGWRVSKSASSPTATKAAP